MSLQGWGYEGAIQPVREPELVAVGNRLEYRRGELVEWYVSDARGLEQGFTLAAPPAERGDGPLVMELSLSGSLSPKLTEDGSAILLTDRRGETFLRYDALAAWDAEGRHLPASMRLQEGRLTLAVNDRGAAYPVTIDPTVSWTQQAKLTASDAASGDFFGVSVAIYGNTVAVGAENNSAAGPVFRFSLRLRAERHELDRAGQAHRQRCGDGGSLRLLRGDLRGHRGRGGRPRR